MRRKSFSLVLLIFIVLCVVALVVLSIILINKPKSKKSNNDENNNSIEAEDQRILTGSYSQLDDAFFDSLENIEEADSTESTTEESSTSETPESSEETPTVPTETPSETTNEVISLNNHNYKLEADASLQTNSANVQELYIKYPNNNFNILYGTDNSKTFSQLKESADLKSDIESKHSITVSSTIKNGNVKNLDLIICKSTDSNGDTSYFVYTPLNDSEVAYAKIYNTEDTKTLIKDLSDPLNELSKIISSIE